MLTNRRLLQPSKAVVALVCSPSKPALAHATQDPISGDYSNRAAMEFGLEIKSLSKYIKTIAIVFAMAFVFGAVSSAKAELYEGMNIVWVNDNGIDCHKPSDYPTGQITWKANITNNNNEGVFIEKAAFHDPKSGCKETTATLRQDLFTMSGKTNYGPKESGQTTFTYNTGAITCGRVQVDAAYRNANGNGDGLVFLGEVIDYGVDCPANNPTPTPSCVDNAMLLAPKIIPATVTAGAAVPFSVQIFNTGTTWFYHGSYYQLHQRTGLNINPPYGHLEPSIHSNQEQIKDFVLTAPSAPGTYTITFQMYHSAGSELLNDKGVVCGPASTQDKYFGSALSMTFVVEKQTPPPTNLTGMIAVFSNAPTTWTVTGPQNFSGTGTYGSYVASVGAYRITGLPDTISASGIDYKFNTVNQTSGELGANNSLIFTINYSQVPKIVPQNPPVITNAGNQQCSQIQVTWTDNSNSETNYYIYRSEQKQNGDYLKYTLIKTLPANSTSYIDKPELNKSYYYIVAAHILSTKEIVPSQPYYSANNNPCVATLDGGVKIVALNGNQQFNVNSIKHNDVVTLQIMVDNLGPSSAYITNFTDELGAYLTNPRNLTVSGPNSVKATPSISGTNQNITLNVSGRKDVGGDKWMVEFDATVSVPSGQNMQQLTNCTNVNYFDEGGTKTERFCLNQILAATEKKGSVDFKEVAP